MKWTLKRLRATLAGLLLLFIIFLILNTISSPTDRSTPGFGAAHSWFLFRDVVGTVVSIALMFACARAFGRRQIDDAMFGLHRRPGSSAAD
jgi:hypothetical protein